MPAQHGGPRTPSKPAPVSNPGKNSARTDGGPKVMDVPSASYGDATDFHDIQTSAPMAAPSAPATPQMSGAATGSPMVPFGDPTARPDEPLTAGSPFGPGATPQPRTAPDQRAKLRAILPVLLRMADLPDTPDATRNAIRYLRGSL
jgi:hypothetical protein